MRVERINLYEERKDVTLTTYILDDSPEMLNGQKRPAVLVCPGGAYLGLSDREGEPVALKFASFGYHAFVLRYSVYGEGVNQEYDLNTPLSVKEHCQYPKPMREIGMAMMEIRNHAKEWLVDMDKVALCGFSAGAHNVSMYANSWHSDTVAGYLGVKPELIKPAVSILGYTLSDYEMLLNSVQPGFTELFFAQSATAYTGYPKPAKELLKKLSPAQHVSEKTPPTFLWATAQDSMVSVQNTLVMAKALADKEIPFEVHVFEEGDHGMSLATQASAAARSQISPDAAKWADLAGVWLEKRFALPLPEKAL